MHILITFACLLSATLSYGFVSIPAYHPLARLDVSVNSFMENAPILSSDLKKAWHDSCRTSKPECKAFPKQLPSIIQAATLRTSLSNVQKALEKVNNGTATPQDFQLLQLEIAFYGDAKLENNELKVTDQESEPIKFGPQNTAYLRAALIIEQLGRSSNWTPEKIAQEKKTFFQNVAAYLNKQSHTQKK